jgi:hypothetical protein
MKVMNERTTNAVREDDSDLCRVNVVALTSSVKTNAEEQDVTAEVESQAQPPLNEDNSEHIRIGFE